MKLIVAVDSNWGIGLRNALLVHIPSDMKFFRSETMGKTIIMGRKTLESFPQSQPLAGRNNIVITKDPAYQVKGAVVVHSIEEAIEESKKYDYLFNKIYVDIYPRLKKDYKKLTEYLQQNNEGIIK